MSKNMQMKKETGKILHRKFLSENIGLLLIAPVFLLLMFTVSNLYQLPAEYVFYLTSIFLILWVTALCPNELLSLCQPVSPYSIQIRLLQKIADIITEQDIVLNNNYSHKPS